MMKIIDRKDVINRRLYKGLIIVKTAIYRVSCLNPTVLCHKKSDRSLDKYSSQEPEVRSKICSMSGF
ncbi:MAG: hypothetical protein KME38_16530 [Spirirestis rafaelensis WJT71-NPBG6]|nr:hypothetical protein [Spirirestis rafaelensis WJT71-NPBG6]